MNKAFLLIPLVLLTSCYKNPIITSNKKAISIYVDGKLITDKWSLSKSHNPDIFFANVKEGSSGQVVFMSDNDVFRTKVSAGEIVDLGVKFKNDLFKQRVIGESLRKKANFSDSFVKENKNQIRVSIPKVYELLNIAISLSSLGQKRGLVYKDTEYYRNVHNYFNKFKDHDFVKSLDIFLISDQWAYFNVKMNGAGFFYRGDQIIRNKSYGTTGFGRNNFLLPLLGKMQKFSKDTNFLKFYEDNKPYYKSLNEFYSEHSVGKIIEWLKHNYPKHSVYNFYNIIYSPLVGHNQSVVTFKDNGVHEIQAHVNFPHSSKYGLKYKNKSKRWMKLFKETILFTELNHPFADRESSEYKSRILKSLKNKDLWLVGKMQRLYPGIKAFNEYMNWALVAIRAYGILGENESLEIIKSTKATMKRRGFIKFSSFLDYFLKEYKSQNKPKVYTLYPKLVSWFENQEK